MSHMKRGMAPKSWPISRKGTTFIAKPNQKGMPVLVLLRDMLKIAQNRKEVKNAIHKNSLLLNGKSIKDEKDGVKLFDVITILPLNQNYRLSLSKKGKFELQEIKEKEAHSKIAKIINKTVLKGKKLQLNFNDGNNLISNIKCKVNDSALINFKDKKIEKCIELKEKSNAIVFAGKHSGESGVIQKIEAKTVELEAGNRIIKVLIKHLMVIE
jgi:small subunit ribosomal protein S4e